MSKTVQRGRRWIALGSVLGVLSAGVVVAAPPTGGALPPQLTLVVSVAGVGDVPADAVGVALNITVTNPSSAGFVTVHPCRDELPLASNVNFVADQTVPNLVISGLDADGDVCIDTLSVTDLVVDIAGYIPAGSPVQPLAEPVRFLDTREGIGSPRRRVEAGQVAYVPVAGSPGVPVNAATVIFNTTVVSPATAGFVTVFPCGQPVPSTSTVNFAAGDIVPNLTVSAVGEGGAVCVYTTATTDLVADVAAFVPSGSSGITMLTAPQRILDTRIGLGGPTRPVDSAVRPVQVTGVGGVPAGATAALVNLTATEGAAPGYAAAFPCGVGLPLVSNLNFGRNQDVANAAIVKLAADGTMCLSANVAVGLVVDVAGYVTGSAAIVPITPRRIGDTREGVEPSCQRGIDQATDLSSVPWKQVYRAYDLVSGATLPTLQLPTLWSSSAFVMADCTTLVVGMTDSVGPQSWRLAADGTVIDNRRLSGFSPGFNVVASDDELFALGFFNTVIRAETGQELFRLPDLGQAVGGGIRNWSLIGASDDGSVLALTALGPNTTAGFQHDVFLFDLDGTLLDGVSLATDVWPVAVSPDMAYVLAFTRAGGPGRYQVVTFANDVVASFPEAVGNTSISARGFATSGVVNVCSFPSFSNSVVPGTALRWSLFTPLRPYAATSLPCLEEVG